MTASAGRSKRLKSWLRVHRKGDAAETPLHCQISEQLRDAIERGELRPGDRLPASRSMAKELRVARNTVEAAIARLVRDGLVERRVGFGTWVVMARAEMHDDVAAQIAREGELQ